MAKLIAQMAALTGGRLIGATLVFLITLLLARSFESDVLASYSLALSAASILSVLLPLGFHAIATLFAAEYRSLGKHQELSAFAKYAHTITFRNAALVLAVVAAGSFFLPDYTSYDVQTLAVFSAVVGYFMAAIYLNSALLIGVEDHYWAHLPDMVVRPAVLLVILFLLGWAGLKSVTFVLAALLGTLVLTSAFQSWALRERLPPGNNEPITPETLESEKKKWWQIAPDHMKITLLWDYFFEFHILLAGLLFIPEQVAALFVCFRIRQLAGFGLRSVYSLRLPKVMAANAHEDKEEAQRLLGSVVRMSGAYAILVWAGIAFAGPYVLQIFGPEYADAQIILLTLMATIVVRGIFGPSTVVLGMARHASFVVKILVSSLILSLLLMWAGSTYLGLWSVAGAYFISTTFSAIAIWWAAKSRAKLNTAIWSK
ncbi:hypothetical protein J7444_19875 [Labrenzia sp. R4_1]|uniref:lipopolysaccharide biosynthesis protein n=1 Tax=Labrenzia sp. R4_1 TaxID=2821106 RepID=UPI001ADB56D5|nr:hypothetical protein [Labrenzia sp. R4_1]MBO9427004.1 hypothetical protein [Labrenzia sp. R4_1]